MLADFPLYFDEDKILQPTEWSESYNVVEKTMSTEAGTDIRQGARFDKLVVDCSFYVTDTWAKLFKQYSQKLSFVLKQYSVIEEDYEERTVVMRNFKMGRLQKSERIRVSNGLYAVTFTLEEL